MGASGWVEVITGSMFSGKTEELIRRVRRALLARQEVQTFKPSIDDRYHETKVVSHQGMTDAQLLGDIQDLPGALRERTQVVALDEAQFFHPAMPALMAIAETVTKVRAICSLCGREASRTFRLTKAEEIIRVGGVNDYEARCRACFLASH